MSNLSDFESALKSAAEKAILSYFKSESWLLPNYESRFKVPKEWITEVWKLVDSESLKISLAKRIEQELADRIVNHIAAELSTDIKQILSDKERRESLRALARTQINSMVASTKEVV